MIRVTTEQSRKAIRLLSKVPGQVPQAIARAINRSSDASRTVMSKGIREAYIIRHSDIVQATRIRRAQPAQKHISATIRVSGTRREIIQFRVTPGNAADQSPKALKVTIRRGKTKKFKGAFVRRGIKSGNPHVLRRVGKERYPVHIKYGPSIPQMANNPKISEAVEQRAREVLGTRLDHEINRVLKGAAK